ncbi:SLAIN motif-containing protein 1-like isoform X2 [Colossoma macropomum]|uniref:SLAIN motif-containing protein 1-like isoform X2 n=1 Tax=Colossoma macropomum TaxID=42526 RepID=UPI0018654957|nr:SLAIN motif-containing protein 1-like isoform X2 [Colossoma macropomum]
MEAAVLKPRITAEGSCGVVNAEIEVKKLQELVRKLERQNEQLRTRAHAVNTLASPRSLPSPPPPLSLFSSTGAGGCCSGLGFSIHSALPPCCAPEEPFPYFQPHSAADTAEEAEHDTGLPSEPTVLDEMELLDLDSIFQCNQESDETWLYSSSKSCSWSGGGLTPLQWCRHVLDHPQPEAEATKRSLCQRLESVNRWRGVFSSSSPSSPAFPHSRVVGVPPLCTSSTSKSCSTPAPSTSACEKPASSTPSSLHPSLLSTLTPIGKDRSPQAERTPTFLYHPASRSRSLRRAPFSTQSSLDSELSASELEDDSISLGYKLQDLTDVQVMARLQEESLRQDYATTSASSCVNSRRSASFSFQFGQRGECNLEEEDDDDEDYGQLPPPQPRLTRTGPLQCGLPHSQTFTSIRDWRLSAPSTPSTPSTPTTLPFQTPASLSTPAYTPEQPSLRASSDKLRRSMPNLVRAPSMPSVPSPANHTGSPTSIRNSQSFDSSSGLARLQSSIPSPGQLQNRVQSVGNFPLSSRQPLKATAYVSPTIKGPSTMTTSASSQSLPSSGIPLPSKGGSIQTPGRSGLPRPASFIGSSSTPRSKLTQPVRSLLTPPKSLATLSALRDSNWRDGCY